jgi:hypothetical protein
MGTYGLPPGGSEVLSYTDLMIEADKAANRGLIIKALNSILETALSQWQMTEDPRFLELGLRATDRLSKLLRLADPEAQVATEAKDPGVLVAKVKKDLLELEARIKG